jgi:hypothetical protein
MTSIGNRLLQTVLGLKVVNVRKWHDLRSERDRLRSEADLNVFYAKSEMPSIVELKQMIEQGKLQIIVPTINSESYIDIVLSFYKRHEIPVKVCVDRKTSDKTAEIAQHFAEVELLDNESSIAEGFAEKFSSSGREWILRIDDDELPSLQMLRFVASILDNETIDVWGFPRLQCVVSTTGRIFASTLHGPHSVHLQWRLYRPQRLKFLKKIHTPGFELPENRLCAPTFAPDLPPINRAIGKLVKSDIEGVVGHEEAVYG